MKRLTVSLGIAVALAALMSSTVLAHPAAPGEAITAICECLGGLDVGPRAVAAGRVLFVKARPKKNLRL